VVYLLAADQPLGGFQSTVANKDNDPNSESAYVGLTTSTNGGSLVFYETDLDVIRELALNAVLEEQDTVNHEVSHAFDSIDAPGEPTDGAGNFSPMTVNLIRTTRKPRS
jgi:hypothetical protein